MNALIVKVRRRWKCFLHKIRWEMIWLSHARYSRKETSAYGAVGIVALVGYWCADSRSTEWPNIWMHFRYLNLSANSSQTSTSIKTPMRKTSKLLLLNETSSLIFLRQVASNLNLPKKNQKSEKEQENCCKKYNVSHSKLSRWSSQKCHLEKCSVLNIPVGVIQYETMFLNRFCETLRVTSSIISR